MGLQSSHFGLVVGQLLWQKMALITKHAVYNWSSIVCVKWEMYEFKTTETVQKRYKSREVTRYVMKPAMVFYFDDPRKRLGIATSSLDVARKMAINLARRFSENPNAVIDVHEHAADFE